MIYDRRFGLPQSIADYLNQPLPDISGIYSLPQTQIQPTLFEEDEQLESLATTGLSPEQLRLLYLQQQQGGGEGRDDDEDIDRTNNLGINSLSDLTGMISTPGIIGGVLAGIPGAIIGRGLGNLYDNYQNQYTDIFGRVNQATQAAIARENLRDLQDRMDRGEVDFSGGISAAQDARRGGQYDGGDGPGSGGSGDSNSPDGGGGYCFDPNTPIQMADGSEKKIKDIQLGDDTKGGEVTGVFQFKAADEIHDYKGVTVAGSHYVKEDGKFIMVKDSPIAVKIDKIPVVYSLDTTNRRIFIKDIEFADYNGDGIAKNFLSNAGVNLSGFDKEVLRQVENRIL
jgi:hypothetical protein